MAQEPETAGVPARRALVAGARAVPLAEAARRMGVAFDDDVRAAARRLPLRFPGPYLDLVDANDPGDPIRRIAWPDAEELRDDPEAFADPVGEDALRPHPIAIRKYPDRVLLLLTSRCHFYCRFCFRAGHGADATLADVEEAVERLAADPTPLEVILSGGDPLVLSDAFLARTIAILGRLRTLRGVRIHTRAPIHDPARVTPELIRALVDAATVPLRFVVHVTHPRELTPEVAAAIARLSANGTPVLSQTVLLAGVNDDARTLADLVVGLDAFGVSPYYLHHPDRIAGTARFRLTLERGRQIYRELRSLAPRSLLPRYVLDLPDGSGKVDVESLVWRGDRLWAAEHADGAISLYEDVER